jgi:acyl dehydratase/NAD(P)-dependent dehydrogenase (short-subunit alcohol dehydrogenase family)
VTLKTETHIGAVSFTTERQDEFATLSGDWNPMHMSPLAARRTQVGQPVVHGIHIALAALETVAATSPSLPSASKLRVRFLKPVYIGEAVQILRVDASETELRLHAVVDGIATTELCLTLGGGSKVRREVQPMTVNLEANCRELSLTEMKGCSGQVQPAATADKIAARFTNATKYLGIDRVTALLCLSRLVGMECPGRDSLFSGFVIDLQLTEASSSLQYFVRSVDDRFRLLEIEVVGLGVQGVVEAFARHPPVPQVPMRDLSALVKSNEFAGQRALIVGGSRGLGELTAKLLAAGGGKPVITYAVGKTDAEQVAEEIKQSGGECQMLQYDVRVPSLEQIESLSATTPYLYYFATGQIFRRRTKRYDPDILNDFLKFYVHGFYELCVSLKGLSKQPMSVFYPSSIAVEERPRDMTEYSMAKAAAEILCADLNRSWPGMHITTVRLPRLLTDQTATVIPTDNANAVDVILPIVRSVQGIRS